MVVFAANSAVGHVYGGKCHDSVRFVAHFRRTRRLGFDHHQPERERGFVMQNATADLAKETNVKNDEDRQSPVATTDLGRCYGKIGISAVAAAARYQGSAKNPAYAPVSSQWRDRFAEAAA
jgi:hypothetical protein